MISQVISTIPAAGKRGIDTRDVFVTKQEAFQDHLQLTTVNELNTYKDQANAVATEVNTNLTTIYEPIQENLASVTTVGNNITNVNTVATNIANVNTTATNLANVNTVTTNIANVNTTAGSISNINILAPKASELTVNATNISNINTTAGAITNINILAPKVSEIGTVATNITNVNTVATNITNVNTVATNMPNVINAATFVTGLVPRVISTDNAIVRFNGITGDVQDSSVNIDDNGNLGTGVTPSTWRSLQRVIELTGGASISNYNGQDNISVSTNTYTNSSNTGIYKNNGYACSYTQATGQHIWSTAPSGTAGNAITWTNAMSLDASGNLILNPAYSASIMPVISFGNSSNTYVQVVARNVSNTERILDCNIGGALKSAILANGTYQSATNVYGSTSDIKLKENIVDTSPKLDKLMQVKVRNFNYIGQEDSKQIGVIAQEIEQIFPSVVFETKDTKQVEVTKERIIPAIEELKDDEGNVVQEAVAESFETYTEIETVETGEVTKNVKYSVIYMMMLKGMQEQQEIINDLRARIEILENK